MIEQLMKEYNIDTQYTSSITKVYIEMIKYNGRNKAIELLKEYLQDFNRLS